MFNHIKTSDTLFESIKRKNNNNDISEKSLGKIEEKIRRVKNSVNYEVFKKSMDDLKRQVSEIKSQTVREKINKVISECLLTESQLNQSTLHEIEPEPTFKRIRSHHTIEEAILCKIVFNDISQQSLNKIEAKVKDKFNKMTLSKTPELFERELLNVQSILKKYDNEVVCEKINKIINKYLDKYEVFIKKNKSIISRIWHAIHSVFDLQEITPRKLNEFKMVIIDSFKCQPI